MVVRQSSEIETNIVSVERIREYTALESEASGQKQPPDEWPSRGQVDVVEYSTRYRDRMPLVLRRLEAHVRGGEKVGIVGRTGAGKSSLTLALFRLIEAVDGKCFSCLLVGKLFLFNLRQFASQRRPLPLVFPRRRAPLKSNLQGFFLYALEISRRHAFDLPPLPHTHSATRLHQGKSHNKYEWHYDNVPLKWFF